jgi:hypothetical protein
MGRRSLLGASSLRRNIMPCEDLLYETFSFIWNWIGFIAYIGRDDCGQINHIALVCDKPNSQIAAQAHESALFCSLILRRGDPISVVRNILQRDAHGLPNTPLGVVIDRLSAQIH